MKKPPEVERAVRADPGLIRGPVDAVSIKASYSRPWEMREFDASSDSHFTLPSESL